MSFLDSEVIIQERDSEQRTAGTKLRQGWQVFLLLSVSLWASVSDFQQKQFEGL
jgi:hypothetical protein